ncbi:amidohydrolase family protein [Gluconacetobacter sp. 1b LMG 1731]|uniref:Amidohydrolase family protein n=2 Tax=Gluconacetobacter dulcium TaxID=2729096 RepID=A0A7W4IME2_9PROT|nr:amidohydrolase family protein [Gluconacetobacter dulcium]MBB2194653.1 amidohydrolase family protein [Gluconacetobacter dulcium]
MNRWRIRLWLGASWVLAGSAPPLPTYAAGPTALAIEGADVFDAIDGRTRRETVLVRGDRITAVGEHVAVPPGTRIVDATGLTLTPGLFDLHTHWTSAGVPATVPAIATAYLKSGVTTVNDFNEAPEAYAPLRAWLTGLAAPHVRFAARISTVGGHGADWADQATTRWITTAEDGRAAVSAALPYRPDLIKAFTDGWRYGMSPDNTSMNEDALAAVASAAHDAGLKVFTHTVTVQRGLIAARAHVDALAHILQDSVLTPTEVEEIHRSGMGEVPTLAVYDPDKPGPLSSKAPQQVAQRHEKFANALRNVKLLHDAGVPIGVGTDAGMPGTPHGPSTLHELALLVRAGLTPAEALTAATATSARLAGIAADRGTIAVGQRADLDLFQDNPATDISAVHHLVAVIEDGRLIWGMDAPPLPDANRQDHRPATPAQLLIDDFERSDGRTSLDTLRTVAADRGPDRSIVVATIIPDDAGHHILSIQAEMSQKKAPYAGIVLPLSRGAIDPVDAHRWAGVRFMVRGSACPARITLDQAALPSLEAPFTVQDRWQTVNVPFSTFHGSPAHGRPDTLAGNGSDLTAIGLGGACTAGSPFWMQIGQVRFY